MELFELCEYVTDKVDVAILTKNNYVSTENMLANKEGIIKATSLPNVKKVQVYGEGDVLISNIRPYFKKIWYSNQTGGCSNDVLVFRAKNGVHKKFLYYILSSDSFFDYATHTSKGTKMPRGDKRAIMKYKVPQISYDVQCKIANVLSCIDEKIINNRQINNNLEQQAQAIFEQNFLSFDRLPTDWTTNSLLGIADYLNGLAMQKFRPKNGEAGIPVLKIKELRQGFCDATSEFCSPTIRPEYIIHDGDVIFSWSGSLLVDFWCGGICGLNQHLFKVTSSLYDKWFYYAWTNHYLRKFSAIALDMATTMGHIKREELSKAEVFIPPPNEYEHIGALLTPIYNLIITNRVENKQLSALRDEILPKLMSGEVDVLDINL